ncbi:MAG: Rnf-Nqr domain containing protein [Bacillota bacterium]
MKNNNILPKLILPGLLPLLGGTTNLGTALVIALSFTVMTVVIRLIYFVLDRIIPQKPRELLWIFVLSLGLGISYSLYILLPELLTFTSDYVNIYLMFLGLTPIVYTGCSKSVKWDSVLATILAFSVFLTLTGVLREFIGQGKILEMELLDFSLIPIISGPVGAFLVPGLLWLIIGMITSGKEAVK